jgi:TonB family protein
MNGPAPWEDSPRSLNIRAIGLSPFVIWLLVAIALLLMSVPRLGAQDSLATARSLYASAAYDEALKMLQQLASSDGLPPGSIREAEEYRFLCLLALGRTNEARESIGAVVTADPLYKLDENNTSPRVLTAFQTVRRELLPDILTRIYNVGKAAYDKKDFAAAEPQFRKVVALAGDPDLQGKGSDLGTLAKGFLDLAVSSTSGAAAPAPANAGGGSPAGASTTTAPTTNAANTIVPVSGAAAPGGSPAGGAGAGAGAARPAAAPAASVSRGGLISPPITLKQPLPAVPPDLARFGPLRSGEIEILIDETGKVEQARFVKSIHPVYDGLVLAASKQWRYEPAKADGVPVKFRKTIRVAIAEPTRNQQQQNQLQNQ